MRSALGLACLLALTGLAGCAEDIGADFEPIQEAGWRAGYTFATQVETSGHVKSTLTIDGATEEEADEDIGPDTAPGRTWKVLATGIRDGGHDHYLVEQTEGHPRIMADGSTGLPAGAHLLGVRAADLTIHAVDTTELARCGQGCDKVTFLRAGDPQHPLVKFPLSRGLSWTTEAPVDESDLGVGESWSITSRVQGMESITVPAGTVDAVRIGHAIEVPDIERFEREVEDEMREDGIEDPDVELTFGGSFVSHYAPSLRFLARTEMVMEMSVHVSGRDDGRAMRGDFEGRIKVAEVLVSAGLTEEPERSLRDILAGRLPKGPSLVPPPQEFPSPLGLRLRQDLDDINAAEAPLVTFSLGTARPAQAGDTFRLRLLDALGRQVAGADGRELGHTFSDMGLYTVVAEHWADGSLQGRSVDTVPVYHDGESLLACGPVLVGISQCPPMAVPVRPGIGSLEVTARPRLAVLPVAEMRLLDHAGTTVDGDTFLTQDADIEVEDFGAFDVLGDWSLVYDTPAGADELEVHVVLQPVGEHDRLEGRALAILKGAAPSFARALLG